MKYSQILNNSCRNCKRSCDLDDKTFICNRVSGLKVTFTKVPIYKDYWWIRYDVCRWREKKEGDEILRLKKK